MTRAKILVVEDDTASMYLMQRWLSKIGYDVLAAVNAETCRTILATTKPQLILMDMRLPIVSGFELIKSLKAEEPVKNVPIIGLSAYASSKDRQRALDCGCEDYDTKPVDFDRLQGKIQKLILSQEVSGA